MNWNAVLRDLAKVRHEIPYLHTWCAMKLVGGIIWRVECTGGDAKTVALILPGFCEGTNETAFLARAFHDAGYRVDSLDGIGWSTMSLRRMVRRGIRRMREFRDVRARVVIVAHSKGAVCAKALAAFFPETVSGIVLLGAPLRGSRLADVFGRIPFLSRGLDLRDLMTTSSFLSALAHRKTQCPVYIVNAIGDGLASTDRCRLKGVRRVRMRKTRGHLALLFSPEVRAKLRAIAHHLRFPDR